MSGRDRDVGRQYVSGNKKRRAKIEKQEKDSAVASKSRKITDFLGGSSSTSEVLPECAILSCFGEEKELSKPDESQTCNEPNDIAINSTCDLSRDELSDLKNNNSKILIYSSDLGSWPTTVDKFN